LHVRDLFLPDAHPYNDARAVDHPTAGRRKELAPVAKKSPLAEKLDEVKDRIAKATSKSKREPGAVTLIAVTKTAAPEQVREILQLGVADLGESRVQVLVQRAPQFNEFHQRQVTGGAQGVSQKLRWHMIGHLQRNKVKPVLPLISLIHSVDSLRLAEELETQATKLDRKVSILMELNAGEEASKYGVAVGAAVHLGEQIAQMQHLQLLGLMTMAPLDAPEAKVRHAFARTREIFEEMRWHKIGGAGFKHLSMGMSNDYEIAIEEGATMVRIGTAIFGGKKEDHEEED
jgi:pyridoxal phosphate enzyme (YggS family)